MADWICPACGGGFPDEEMLRDTDAQACPWCAWSIHIYRERDERPDKMIQTGVRGEFDDGGEYPSVAEILSRDASDNDEE